MEKKELKPALVFEQFAKINEIPRPSKHEENMIEYLKEFGKSHQLGHARHGAVVVEDFANHTGGREAAHFG